MKTVLLDMDGILSNFVNAACQAHNRLYLYDLLINRGKFDMDKIWGMTPEEFWKPTNNYEFWRSMSIMPDAHQIVDLLAIRGYTVLICSSPSQSPHCIRGKVDWLKTHFPKLSYAFMKHKELLNQYPLIDDRDSNIDKHGPNGFLYPRPWNSLHGIENPYKYFKKEFQV